VVSKNEDLRKYRKKHRYKALVRDNFKCIVCEYQGVDRDADEVHHVYGRGVWNTRKKYEHYSKLLSICQPHHYDYHFVKKITSKELIITCLGYANCITF